MIQRNWGAQTWLVEMQNGRATLKTSLAVPHKTKHAITVRPRNCTVGCQSQTNHNLSMSVHSSFFCNSHAWK